MSLSDPRLLLPLEVVFAHLGNSYFDKFFASAIKCLVSRVGDKVSRLHVSKFKTRRPLPVKYAHIQKQIRTHFVITARPAAPVAKWLLTQDIERMQIIISPARESETARRATHNNRTSHILTRPPINQGYTGLYITEKHT